MTIHAAGTFEVDAKPLPADEKVPGLTVGRVAVAKRFLGDLEGTSKGEMMTADPGVKGSGGYAAIEKITGTLKGLAGSFVAVHRGTMRRGREFDMSIVIVPDSGTGRLEGLAGMMTITIVDGKHFYELNGTLPE